VNISHYISELLYDHDCVIVPGLGGFVVNPMSARIDRSSHAFSPPSREISFNKNLTRNDGLLADLIAEKEHFSYEKANEFLKEYVGGAASKLRNGEDFELSRVGVLHLDNSGNIQFIPDTSISYSKDAFGLSKFQSPAIVRERIEKKLEQRILQSVKPVDDRPETTVEKQPIAIRKYWPAAAAVIAICLVVFGVLKTNVLDSISINYSDLNPFKATADGIYAPRSEDNLVKEDTPTERDEINEWLESIPENIEPAPEAIEVKKIDVVKRFHVIGGCFEFEKNAKRLLRRLKKKGFDASIVGKNRRGLTRVSYGSFETRKEARKELRRIKRDYIKSAWLYVSK